MMNSIFSRFFPHAVRCFGSRACACGKFEGQLIIRSRIGPFAARFRFRLSPRIVNQSNGPGNGQKQVRDKFSGIDVVAFRRIGTGSDAARLRCNDVARLVRRSFLSLSERRQSDRLAETKGWRQLRLLEVLTLSSFSMRSPLRAGSRLRCPPPTVASPAHRIPLRFSRRFFSARARKTFTKRI